MASSSNPITSVPDPSQSSAFASVITQVQPGQVTAARPVRPRKVAKSTSEGDAAKKKKKRRQGAPELAAQAGTSIRATGGAAASSQEAAVRAAAAAGSSDALRQAHGANAVRNDIATSTEGTTTTQHLAGGENDVVVEHSHQPSSTLVEGSTAGNTLTNPEAPSTAAPAVVTSGPGQDLDRAAEKLASESSDGTVEKQGLVAVPGTTSSSADVRRTNTVATAKPVQAATTSASGPSQRPAGHREKPRQKKPGFAQRVIALITCSSGAASMAQEDLNEKTGSHSQGQSARSRTTGKSGSESLPTKVMVPPRTPTSKGGSRLGGEDANSSLGPTTPGGGTKLPREETGDVMSGAVVPPGAAFVAPGDFSGADAGLGLGAAGTTAAQHRKSRASGDASKTESEIDEDYDDDDDEDEDDDLDLEDDFMDDDQTEEQRLIMQGGMGIPVDEFGNPQPLLGPIVREDLGRKCLVLDLDETLVHSSFKVMPADFIVPVEIEGTVHNVYVIKRPGVDEFMRRMGEIYEVVVFTASLSKYADPVLDMLDIHHAVRHRLFRESCYNHKGNYVKDLSQLGRDIGDTIIIDNSPASYIFHPNNAVPISSWFNDPHDTELTDLCPFLADLCEVDDVRAALDGGLF